MSTNNQVIDYIDIVLPIPVACLTVLEEALKKAETECLFFEVTPRIKQKSLYVNSNDLVTLMGYIDPDQLSELESARLRKTIMAELDQALLRSTSLHKQAHYKWCLTAAKTFDLGRYL
jgi:hypothetical protein